MSYKRDLEAFIVENAINTCYIDSLLMSIFYPQTNMIGEGLLKNDCPPAATYLQEYINNQFVVPVRDCRSVLSDQIEYIRILSVDAGWMAHADKSNPDFFTEQQDVAEYYTFIMETFKGVPIEIQRRSITEGMPNKSDIGEIEKVPYVPVSVPDGVTRLDISEALQLWMEDNHSMVNRSVEGGKGEQMVGSLNTYYIVNIPPLLCIAINRFKNPHQRDYTDIIIQKKIAPFKNNSALPNAHKYIFQAAICHRGQSPRAGHYYAIIADDDKYFLFDDQIVPSLVEVVLRGDFKNKDVVDMLKKDVVFIIYRYDG